MKDFLTKTPILTGDEEIIAKAGQDIGDPWSKEDQNPGIFGIRPLDIKGKITPEYKKLLEALHMVNLKPTQPVKPSSNIEKLNKKWRKIQEYRKIKNKIAVKRIEKLQTGFTKEDIQDILKQKERR